MSWSSSDVRARRPWTAGACALVLFVLLAPTGGWSACAGGAVTAGECIDRTVTLIGITVPASSHPGLWLVSDVLAGAVARLLVTALVRRAARIERADDLA